MEESQNSLSRPTEGQRTGLEEPKHRWTEARFAVAAVEVDELQPYCSALLGFPARFFLRCRNLLPRRGAPESDFMVRT